MQSLQRFLERTLKLEINQDKSQVVPTNQVAFLGFTFRGTKICWSKVRELRKLGTSLHAAISVAISRKGPWRLSRTLATQTGMTNDWLKDQGLLSVKELWVHIHYPATAR